MIKLLEKDNIGFTLSEVLITLVIIGVVAAITLPTIYADYIEREKIAKVKKMYSTLGNAITFVKTEGGDLYFDNPEDTQEEINEWYDIYLRRRLHTMKVCQGNVTQVKDCWTQPKCLNGNCGGVGTGNAMVSAILTDGTTIMMDRWTPSTFGVISKYGETDGIIFYFDINGSKAPNTIGKDIFVSVFISQEGFVPAYRDRTRSEIDSNCSKSGNGVSCIMKYLNKS